MADPSDEQPNGKTSSAPENSSGGKDSKDSADKKVGWIEGLAKRSTGLPEDVSRKESKKGEKSPWSYAGLGIQFAGSIALFAWFGFELDRKMGWTPWGLVSLSMIAVIGNLYLLIKENLKDDGPDKGRTK